MMCMNIFFCSHVSYLSIHVCLCIGARACMRACVRACYLTKKLDSLFSYQEDGMAVRGVVVA